MSELALLYTTFANREDAGRVAETILAERLAACVNILAPCTSIYRWKGAVERADEVPALFKTTPELAGQLRARIAVLHPYELPAIETWPTVAGEAVADWIVAETQ